MPISSFGTGLQRVISFLPGTYGTSLVRNHAMRGALAQMEEEGIPSGVIDSLCDVLDCNLYFFDHKVTIGAMLLVLLLSIAVLLGGYILLNLRKMQKVGRWIFDDFSVKVSYQQIAEKNYSFSAGQYFEVKIEYVELSEEEFNNRMVAYASRLNQLFAEGKELEQSIKERLEELKYE